MITGFLVAMQLQFVIPQNDESSPQRDQFVSHLHLASTVQARRAIARVSITVLGLFVLAEIVLSHARYPTPRLMYLVALAGAAFHVIELVFLLHRSTLSGRSVRAFARASITCNAALPFLLAAATRQFHTHYFGLLILPVLEAALCFSLSATLIVSLISSMCAFFWVAYAADFKPPYQVGELLEATTLVLIYFVVGTLVWWLVALLNRREELLESRLKDLEAAKAQLVEGEKLAAVGRLASAVAHEIRNPVAIISSALEAASSSAFTSEDRAEMSRIAVAESRRLEKLTTDFLAYAQPGVSTFTQVDAVALVGHIVSITRAQALNKHVTLQIVSDGDCTVTGNEGQLQQALVNLLLNAVDASPDSGRIAVEVKKHQGDAVVVIENQGAPIPADAVPKIFEPFFTAKPGGTGLGLAIARNVVEKHGGHLELVCNQQDCIIFQITLPLRDTKIQISSDEQQLAARRFHGAHPDR